MCQKSKVFIILTSTVYVYLKYVPNQTDLSLKKQFTVSRVTFQNTNETETPSICRTVSKFVREGFQTASRHLRLFRRNSRDYVAPEVESCGGSRGSGDAPRPLAVTRESCRSLPSVLEEDLILNGNVRSIPKIMRHYVGSDESNVVNVHRRGRSSSFAVARNTHATASLTPVE